MIEVLEKAIEKVKKLSKARQECTSAAAGLLPYTIFCRVDPALALVQIARVIHSTREESRQAARVTAAGQSGRRTTLGDRLRYAASSANTLTS